MNFCMDQVLYFMELGKVCGFSIYRQDLEKVIENKHELRKKQ